MTSVPLRIILSLFATLVLCQCGTPSPPSCLTLPFASREDAGEMLAGARRAWDDFGRTGSAKDRDRYNRCVAVLIDRIRCGGGDRHAKAAAMGTRIDNSHSLGAGVRFDDLHTIIPASKINTKGVGERHADAGLGIPMVGWISYGDNTEPLYPFAPPTGLPLNLTAILDFSQPTPTWRFVYPGAVDSLRVNGRDSKLAADWSAPSALYWLMSDLDDLDLAKVILPGRFTKQTNLYAAAPYDPDKIPVIFIHGLYSSPGTYKVMFNDLMGKPWFRENYQAWFFSYPTGTSWVYNAAFFRDHLRLATAEAEKHGSLENWQNMVLVGHSMGGVISHASLIDPGSRFYDNNFDNPIEELEVSDPARQAIRRTTLYQPVTEPKRVVFLAAPHRGSPSANRFLSRFISNLIRLPKTMTIDLVDVTLNELGTSMVDGRERRPPQTSIGTLAPNFDGYAALNASPFRDDLVIHSVIGDRGRLDSPDSSDGIVPYWSSHLTPVASELVVPYGHSMTRKPETVAEVGRILKLHLEER